VSTGWLICGEDIVDASLSSHGSWHGRSGEG
jgi:hypothetical protein